MINSTSLIYRITNQVNGKAYIGFTTNLKERLNDHRYRDGRPTYFHNSIEKYGWKNFDTEVLFESWDEDWCLKVMEPKFIDEYGTFGKYGYNSTKGGEGNLGLVMSDEAKAKISKANKGKPCPEHVKEISRNRKHTEEEKRKRSESQKASYTEERRQKMKEWATGRKHTQETKDKIAKSKRGIPLTEEHKRKVSEGRMGVEPWNKGIERTEYIGEGNPFFGKTHTPETIEKIKAANKGRVVSEETRRKLSEAGKKRKHSEETKRKMRDAHKRRKAA